MINLTRKRKYIRMKSDIFTKVIYNNNAIRGGIKNISAGGVKINLQEKNLFTSGDIVELHFRYKEKNLKTFGIVVREESKHSNLGYGIKFIYQDKKDKEYINEKVLEDYLDETG